MSADFRTTSWSLVLTAQDGDNERSREALASLCEVYWPPLYAFVRRRGHDRDEAADLTQAFFLHLLDKGGLQDLKPAAGRFRSFLLASLKNLLADERAREQALKRGAGRRPIRLDLDTAENAARLEPVENLTPDLIFEKRWALTVLHRVLGQLREEFAREDNAQRFERLKGFITGEQPTPPYRQVAHDLEMTEEAVKMAVHRLRKRYGKILRAEIAQTVSRPEEVDDEIRHLLSALRS
jgi:RNA polymerase sigma-70 factor (ECF subfamily)